MKIVPFATAYALATAALMMPVTSSHAATTASSAGAAANEPEPALEEITVTAERLKKDLQKTPQFITVKKGDELRAEGKIRLEEVLQGVAGLTMQTDAIGQDNNIFMRGISNGAAGVSIVVDGVAQAIGTQSSAATYRFTTLDLAQVEVARGVQNGAGVSALSGAVSLISNQPTFNWDANGSLTVGGYNLQNTQGVLNIPFSSNQALRIALSRESRDAYYSGGLGEVKNTALRLRYRWQPRDNLDIGVTYSQNRVGGASNGANGILYSGRWQQIAQGQSYTFTNPYTGVSSNWTYSGSSPTGNVIVPNGNVLAGYTAANAGTNTVGTGTLAVSGANANLTNNGQFFYPAPACLANARFTNAGTVTAFTSQAALAAALTALGPATAAWGCQLNTVSIRDTVDFYSRSNPWDDGFDYSLWRNTPLFEGLNRQASITIDWDTKYGALQVQPSLLYARSYLTEPARGTGWMEGGSPPTRSWRFDTSFTSKMIGDFQYVLGFNGNQTQAAEDGLPVGANARVVSAPTLPWTNIAANGTTTATNGVTPNGGAMSVLNTNCYFVTPAVTGSATLATARGLVNSQDCITGSYLVGTGSRSHSLTADLRYTLWDRLQINGVIRYDNNSTEARNATPGFLVDPSTGQRYVWVLPQSTLSTATALAANPNSPYILPYRMNLSNNDLQQIADAYPVFKRNYSGNTYTLNLQYEITPAVTAYVRLATGTTAGMAAGVATSSFLLNLPDARVPTFSGNAAAAAVARNGTPFQMVITPPNPNDTDLPNGEQTRQWTTGMKSRWFDGRLQLNIEGFLNRYTNRAIANIVGALPTDVFNLQTNPTANQTCNAAGTSPTTAIPFVIVLDPAGTPTNRGSSCFNNVTTNFTGVLLTQGIDLDLTWVPTVNDRVDITAEILRTKLDSIGNLPIVSAASLRPFVVNGTNDALLTYYANLFNDHAPQALGQQLANAPKYTFNTSYQHRFSLPNGSSLTPRVQFNYTAAKYISSGGGGNPSTDQSTVLDSNWAIDNGRRLPTVVPGTGLWNMFLNFEAASGKWNVNAYVNNVRNTPVLVSAFGLSTFSIGSRATNDLQRYVIGGNATIGAPRTMGVTISASL